MKKIAITGIDGETRILLTHALSYITGYDVVRQRAYSSQAIRYNLNSELEKCNWQELFIYIISSFSERIEIEQNFDKYISNGSVFNELAYMEAFCKSSIRMNKERTNMLTGIKKIIIEYAMREYDCVIHIDSTDINSDIFSKEIETSIRSMAEMCATKFIIQNGSILTDLLEIISGEMKVNPVYPIEVALNKAKQELYNSQIQ